MLARATLELDGVRFHYEFRNRSDVAYEMIYAVTDPRLTGMFHDVRLERTYVHRADGFDLLASDRPNRVTMPLDEWLPARYMSHCQCPPADRAPGRHHLLQCLAGVDQPFLATLDGPQMRGRHVLTGPR
jgi:hypothetical protein